EVRGALHVVWRIQRGLPSLRTPRTLRRLERAFRISKERDGFALLHYSIQHDHLHLVVEATSRQKLSRSLQSLGIRIAKSMNSLWHRSRGHVFAERYFARLLEDMRQIWRAFRYVLNNGRKHGVWSAPNHADPYSSGGWFIKWRSSDIRRPLRRSPVVEWSWSLMLPVIPIDFVPGT